MPNELTYIAGRMRGEPECNFPAFDKAAARLEALGHTVYNPAHADRESGFDPLDTDAITDAFMAEAWHRNIEALNKATAIAIIPARWEQSEGARYEAITAHIRNLPVLSAETGERNAQLLARVNKLAEQALRQPLGDTAQADDGEGRTFSSGSVRDSRKGKGRMDLLPPLALIEVAKLYEHGAANYGDRNWEKGQPLDSYTDSGLRHMLRWMAGDCDEDHLVSAAWNLLSAIETRERVKRGLLPEELLTIPSSYVRQAG